MTLIIICLVITLLVSFFKVRWGLYLILAILPAYVWRTQIGFMPTTFLELAIYVVFSTWFLKAIGQRSLCRKIKRLWQLSKQFRLPIIIFFLAAILATLFSPDQRLSLGVLKGWFFDPLLVFILFLDCFRGRRFLKKAAICLFLAAAWASWFGLFEYIRGVGLDSDGRLNSVYIPANYVGMFITPILVLAFSLVRNAKGKIMRPVFFVFGFGILLALYLSKSYGAWLGFFASLVFLWFQVKLPRRRLKYLLIFALFVICLSLLQVRSEKFGRLFAFGYRTSSATRLEIWQTAVLMIREHPVFGVGLGNFEAAYREDVPRIVFPPLEWLVVKPHNLYLNLWIEMGILGLLAFLALVFLFFRRGLKYRADPVVKYALAAMIVLLAHGLVDTPYFKNDLSVLFWVLIGFVLVCQNKNEHSSC